MPLKKEAIILKSPAEIEVMRSSCLIVAEVLAILKDNTKAGVTTLDLEKIAVEEIKKRKAAPAFKGYKGYPFCLCTSINEQVVHGMPSARVVKDGDIVSIDCGVLFDGFYGDSAVTIPVGRVDARTARLVEVTAASLDKAIDKARVDLRLMDISSAVQTYVEAEGFSVVRDFVGHGIGRALHEPPQVPNFGTPGMGVRLKAGMVIAIEPMINSGTWKVDVLKDGWTVVTQDGAPSAHFEHTVAITPEGPYVLSRL